MKALLTGDIVCNEVTPKFGLKRYIDSRMEQWVLENNIQLTDPFLKFDVTFDKISNRKRPHLRTGCYIRVNGEVQMWCGDGAGRNARTAFDRAMSRILKIYHGVDTSYMPMHAMAV